MWVHTFEIKCNIFFQIDNSNIFLSSWKEISLNKYAKHLKTLKTYKLMVYKALALI